MPIAKDKQTERAARNLCRLCDAPRTVKADGTLSPLCAEHLKYFRTYQAQWRAENTPPPRNRCTRCRKVGHHAGKCREST